MRLFRIASNLRGGTFGMIARYYTYIFLTLKDHYSSQFADNHDMALASGIIDATNYITKGLLAPLQIKNAFNGVLVGRCVSLASTESFGALMPDVVINHSERGSRSFNTTALHSNPQFIAYIVQLQAIINEIENRRILPRDIIETLIDKKGLMATHVERACKEYARDGTHIPWLSDSVQMAMGPAKQQLFIGTIDFRDA